MYVMATNVMEVNMNKCNCGKKATSTWLIVEPETKRHKGSAREISFCNDCKPKQDTKTMYQI